MPPSPPPLVFPYRFSLPEGYTLIADYTGDLPARKRYRLSRDIDNYSLPVLLKKDAEPPSKEDILNAFPSESEDETPTAEFN